MCYVGYESFWNIRNNYLDDNSKMKKIQGSRFSGIFCLLYLQGQVKLLNFFPIVATFLPSCKADMRCVQINCISIVLRSSFRFVIDFSDSTTDWCLFLWIDWFSGIPNRPWYHGQKVFRGFAIKVRNFCEVGGLNHARLIFSRDV